MYLVVSFAISFVEAMPVLLLGVFAYGIAEFLHLHFHKHAARLGEYRMSGIAILVIAGVTIVFAAFTPFTNTLYAAVGSNFALFDAGLSPLGFLYGLVAYEFAYWVQHWLAHNVRLLWCLHSPHHAPSSMNMFVGFNHSFVESVFYMPLMLGLLPALLGVHPIVIGVVSVIDVIWGNLLHISDRVVTQRYGVLERFLQTPSYHRVHHAKNVRYMDTNYNSITLLWDWLMGTLEELDDSDPVDFGITRNVDTTSFFDVHVGEVGLLWRDVRSAASWKSAVLYLLKPPGWVETGESRTAAARKARLQARLASGR